MINAKIVFIMILITFVTLCGCTSTPDKGVVDFIAEAKKQNPGYVENVIVIAKPTVFKYSAGEYRDPFESAGTLRAASELVNEHHVGGPNPNRPREILEGFPMDLLRMVGTLEREGVFFALIKDSNNVVHLAKVGNYLGENSGKIQKITEKEIEVKEWVPNGKGGWQSHLVAMPLLGTATTITDNNQAKIKGAIKKAPAEQVPGKTPAEKPTQGLRNVRQGN